MKRKARTWLRRQLFTPAQLVGAVVLVAGLALSGGRAAAADADAKADAPAEAPNEETAKLAQALKDIEQLKYPEAQQLLFAVVQSGHATPEQLSKAYFGIGEVEAAQGNEVESTDSFYLALMIRPATLYPPGGSPKIRERLNAARSRVTEVGVLEASAQLDHGVLDVRLRNDPLQLVKKIEVLTTRASDVGHVTLDRKAQRVQIEPDVQTIRVVLHDEAGNELKSIDVNPASKGSAAGPAALGRKPPIWQSWGLWAGVAGAFAVGGTYFILQVGTMENDVKAAKAETPPSAPKIRNFENRRDRVGTYGVVGFSLAGAAAVTAGALLLFHDNAAPASDAKASNEARLVPNLGPGQVGADFSMRF